MTTDIRKNRNLRGMESSGSLERLVCVWMEMAHRQKLLCIDYVEHIAANDIELARGAATSMAAAAEEMHVVTTQLAPLVAKRG